MRKTLLSICFLVIATLAMAIDYKQAIVLYPDGAPDDNGITTPETDDNGVWNNVSVPMMYTYLPTGTAKGTILLIPGGGYRNITYTKEGKDIAEKLIAQGWAAVVLKYRLPNGHCQIPLEDACRAMELLRENAVQYKLNPNAPFGVAGFSAGGHVAAMLMTKYRSTKARPDFGLLCYPVISMDETITHAGSRDRLLGTSHPSAQMIVEWSADLQVDKNTPPCFIAVSQNDNTVPVDNSILMFDALNRNNILTQMLVFPDGAHGWGGKGASLTQRDVLETAVFHFINIMKPQPTQLPVIKITTETKRLTEGQVQIIKNSDIYNVQGAKLE